MLTGRLSVPQLNNLQSFWSELLNNNKTHLYEFCNLAKLAIFIGDPYATQWVKEAFINQYKLNKGAANLEALLIDIIDRLKGQKKTCELTVDALNYLQTQDYKNAIPLFAEAIHLGDPDAMSGLGFLTLFGLGIQKDLNRAIALFDWGIKLGRAPLILGYLKEFGSIDDSLIDALWDHCLMENQTLSQENFQFLRGYTEKFVDLFVQIDDPTLLNWMMSKGHAVATLLALPTKQNATSSGSSSPRLFASDEKGTEHYPDAFQVAQKRAQAHYEQVINQQPTTTKDASH